MLLTEKITSLLNDAFEHRGYEIVRVKLFQQQNLTLQIMIDRLDGADVVIDDCSTMSKVASAILDVHDPISDHYDLEMSSPGLYRPLTKIQHFQRFKGEKVKIKLSHPLGLTSTDTENVSVADDCMDEDTQKRYRGIIQTINDNAIELDIEHGDGSKHGIVSIPFDLITDAILQPEINFGKTKDKNAK